jgi:hypothetical protein
MLLLPFFAIVAVISMGIAGALLFAVEAVCRRGA